MPVLSGFGRREDEGRENGAATIIINFIDAQKRVAQLDAVTGAISFQAVPNPHKKAFTLTDLRTMQAKLQKDSPIMAFYKTAERELLSHIEKTPETAAARMVTAEPQVAVDPLMARADMRAR